MRQIGLKLCVLLFAGLILLNGCSNTESIQQIEVYTSGTLGENSEGYFEQNGYKKVNAITSTETSEEHLVSEIKAIEDHYDLEGNYLKTKIIHHTFEKSFVTSLEEDEERKKEIQEPSTLLIPDDDMDDFQLDDLSKEEQEKVKENVESLMNRL